MIRVRATTEYVTGAALHAQRSGSPLEIGIANLYSKGGADAGKLYRTLDEATDDTLEVWKVNDLAAIRSAIDAGGKTDAQIGDAAFSNPPSSLSSAEKTAVRDAIGAGTTAPVAGLAGLRTESISFEAQARSVNSAELVPTNDPLALVHPDDDSDLQLLSSVNGNDFTVAPGLYLLTATGEISPRQVGRFEIDLRQASDNEVVAGLSRVSFSGIGNDPNVFEPPFTATGFWHVMQTITVNAYMERYERDVGIRNVTVEFSRLTSEDALHSVDWYDSLPSDLMEFGVGKVIYVVGDGLYKVASNSLPNRFEGYLAEFRYGGSNLRGTSAADTEYGAHGAFAANPDGAIRAFVAHPDGTLDVLFDKGRYEAVKGSAVANDDTLRLVWSFLDPGENSQEAGTDTLSFTGENVADEDLRFRATGSGLRNAAVGALWAVQVQQSDGSAFFTHAAHTKHWIELSFGSVDQYARNQINHHVIDPLEPLDTDEANGGEVVLNDHRFYQLHRTDDTEEDVFAGMPLEFTDGGETYKGTSLSDSRYGSRGRFTSNPGSKIGAFTVGGGRSDTVAIRLDKLAYETAKGSAVADDDEIILDLTDGATDAVVTLTYVRTEGDYVVFLANDDAASDIVWDMDERSEWFLRVLSAYDTQTQTGTPLFEHDADTPHFNEYPVDGVDRFARDTLSDMAAFFAAVKSWEFVEPDGGIGSREVGRTAGETRDEAITGELDPDRELVAALRVTEEYELDRTLRLQCNIGYFLRKTQGITTSGAVGAVQVSLAVQRSGAADRILRQLHAATFTLSQFNDQYAAVGNALRYSDTADVTHAVDESWTDFSNFDLRKGDILVFHFRANAINGNALVKIEMQDLDITLTKGL